ncbi:hypothetical protein NC651_040516 [Populus alba x Populus x berolinensis]|nr:hypothetical protein NC651_040516 [Populus alba x Populus x berolinensis]
MFIKTHCIVNCTFGGGMVCCNTKHRHLVQGQSYPTTKISKDAGGRLHPRLRTPGVGARLVSLAAPQVSRYADLRAGFGHA